MHSHAQVCIVGATTRTGPFVWALPHWNWILMRSTGAARRELFDLLEMRAAQITRKIKRLSVHRRGFYLYLSSLSFTNYNSSKERLLVDG